MFERIEFVARSVVFLALTFSLICSCYRAVPSRSRIFFEERSRFNDTHEAVVFHVLPIGYIVRMCSFASFCLASSTTFVVTCGEDSEIFYFVFGAVGVRFHEKVNREMEG